MKTLKNLIWMAALTLTAATWSACSNEDVPTAAEQPAQSRTFTVTTTLSPRNGGTRSTMTDNGDGSISAEWQKDDVIWVLYKNTDGDDVEATATVTAVDPSTKAATIRVTLTNPKDGGNISFGYPAGFFNNPKDPCNDQTGTLDDINANFAAISGTETMTVSGSDITLPAVTMMPAMCIWKFSFTDGTDDITSDITKLVIEFPNSDPFYRTYTVTPTLLDNIYVAMYGDVINAQPICITAVTATGVYRKAAASVTLDAGKTYTSPDLALKKAEVGKVLGADGNIYDNAAATPGGNTAVAMIAYVGSETGESAYNFTHGLALAMSDASGNSIRVWSTSTSSTVHSYTPYGSNAFSSKSESGLQYNDETHDSDTYPPFKAAMANNSTAAPTGCSAWFLPTGYQWNQMINACKNVLGTKNDQRDLRDGFKSRGGTNLKADDYWSSTELSAEYAWYYSFYYGNWSEGHKSKGCYVRSCLAF